ncbi:transketolase [Consotaella salsifontis]|uniref:Transketolase n=1 Tax=Consotaella salsifontis TaxID=1365950 RepID=A0A1T4T3W1_9HYPH|nr:transketolase [Consotaella salsifontis]SKA35143.1 transketolase [Consotaella salsifontis]
MNSPEKLRRMAHAIRFLAADAVEAAQSGHPGLPMGMADVATVLFSRYLTFDPKTPGWPDRDRFVLSAGHGSMLLYSLLYLTGYEDIGIDDIKAFRQLGSRTPGHPEYGDAAGIETTTGPLGQGLGNAVGMAIAERILNARFGNDIVDHFTYVIAGDGDLMEGISQEAITLAGHLQLNRLVVLWDHNGISIDGKLELSDSTDQLERFAASGWNTSSCDGQDAEDIARAIDAARESDRPTLIACRTTIGFGAPTKAGTSKAHGSPLGAEEIAGAREALGWEAGPFEVPSDVLDAWRLAGLRSATKRKEWEKRLAALDPETRGDFERRSRRDLPSGLSRAIESLKAQIIEKKPEVATRKASEMALEVINDILPETVGGSADLTPSNNTLTKTLHEIAPGRYDGRYIHYGIREHGMAAAMNGLALHGGLIPYGGTFLTFSDYARGAIRLSALMGVRVVYVLTHDSIGLGEDGPTHQPVEHLAALRAIPKLRVFRPADAVETAECWQIALENKEGPSVLALSRQNLATVRTEPVDGNLCARGAYELMAASDEAVASIFATGSEIGIAVEARRQLESEGVPTRVVSVPSFELFELQSPEYRRSILGEGTVKVAVEAGIKQGWERFIGCEGAFVGMTGFGASGKIEDLYRHFGITAESVVSAVRQMVNTND